MRCNKPILSSISFPKSQVCKYNYVSSYGSDIINEILNKRTKSLAFEWTWCPQPKKNKWERKKKKKIEWAKKILNSKHSHQLVFKTSHQIIKQPLESQSIFFFVYSSFSDHSTHNWYIFNFLLNISEDSSSEIAFFFNIFL